MPRPTCLVLALVAIGGALPASIASAQGLIIDRRPNVPVARTFEVREVTVDARIRDQVAEIPAIRAYLNSDRRIAFNTDGIFRHYPELDAA